MVATTLSKDTRWCPSPSRQIRESNYRHFLAGNATRPHDERASGRANDRLGLKERVSEVGFGNVGLFRWAGVMNSEARRRAGAASAALTTRKGQRKKFRRKSLVTH
jgi:hypothetical protein